MTKINPQFVATPKNTTISRKQEEYKLGYIAAQGDKEQQERAQKLISDLKARLGNNISNAYIKLATILSKDKNATVDDILNTYSQLSHRVDSHGNESLLSPNGVEEILNDYIRDLADRATAYLNSDTITVAKIQYALEQWSHGEEYHIPTTEKDAPQNTTITRDDLFKHLEQNTKYLNFTVTKGHN